MNKISLVLKYFQKENQLTTKNRDYQRTISTLFAWLTDSDKVTNDKTTKFFPHKDTKAIIIAKQNGRIAGLEEVGYLLKKYTKLVFNPKIKDGSEISNKDTIAEISGKAHDILAFERTILNILQRMSGIATATNNLITLINLQFKTHNSQPFIAATRKTPWMQIDKKAVAMGGGLTHRLNLSDGILVKDNHLIFVSIEKALRILTDKYKNELIEVEVTEAKQAYKTISTFNKLNSPNNLALMFDNFTPQIAKQTLTNLRKEFDLSAIIFEASGGIDKNNILLWSKTGVDILSLGSLTHSSKATNLSLEFILLKEFGQKIISF
ncbi:carboxylating nicotinate-nucleotide diphosphorylase [Candidatus Gottesmanbacteria bacterium]|nr:carboxylating nicotinate-nucleotide diphosphorylase [Candidatus Gottesmanbacteria bacterium]